MGPFGDEPAEPCASLGAHSGRRVAGFEPRLGHRELALQLLQPRREPARFRAARGRSAARPTRDLFGQRARLPALGVVQRLPHRARTAALQPVGEDRLVDRALVEREGEAALFRGEPGAHPDDAALGGCQLAEGLAEPPVPVRQRGQDRPRCQLDARVAPAAGEAQRALRQCSGRRGATGIPLGGRCDGVRPRRPRDHPPALQQRPGGARARRRRPPLRPAAGGAGQRLGLAGRQERRPDAVAFGFVQRAPAREEPRCGAWPAELQRRPTARAERLREVGPATRLAAEGVRRASRARFGLLGPIQPQQRLGRVEIAGGGPRSIAELQLAFPHVVEARQRRIEQPFQQVDPGQRVVGLRRQRREPLAREVGAGGLVPAPGGSRSIERRQDVGLVVVDERQPPPVPGAGELLARGAIECQRLAVAVEPVLQVAEVQRQPTEPPRVAVPGARVAGPRGSGRGPCADRVPRLHRDVDQDPLHVAGIGPEPGITIDRGRSGEPQPGLGRTPGEVGQDPGRVLGRPGRARLAGRRRVTGQLAGRSRRTPRIGPREIGEARLERREPPRVEPAAGRAAPGEHLRRCRRRARSPRSRPPAGRRPRAPA